MNLQCTYYAASFDPFYHKFIALPKWVICKHWGYMNWLLFLLSVALTKKLDPCDPCYKCQMKGPVGPEGKMGCQGDEGPMGYQGQRGPAGKSGSTTSSTGSALWAYVDSVLVNMTDDGQIPFDTVQINGNSFLYQGDQVIMIIEDGQYQFVYSMGVVDGGMFYISINGTQGAQNTVFGTSYYTPNFTSNRNIVGQTILSLQANDRITVRFLEASSPSVPDPFNYLPYVNLLIVKLNGTSVN